MPRQSSIRKLPPEIRDRIGQLLDQGCSLDEILERLDLPVSRSALGRYKQHIDQVTERIRRSRMIAEAAVRTLGKEPESKTTRLNIELLHGVLSDMLMQIPAPGDEVDPDGQPVQLTLDPMGAMLLAKAMDHLAKAKKTDADLITKLREEARREAESKLDQAASEVADEAKTGPMTPEQILERVKAIYRGEA